MKEDRLFILWNTLAPVAFGFFSFLFIRTIRIEDDYIHLAAAAYVLIVFVSFVMNTRYRLKRKGWEIVGIATLQLLAMSIIVFAVIMLAGLRGIQC